MVPTLTQTISVSSTQSWVQYSGWSSRIRLRRVPPEVAAAKASTRPPNGSMLARYAASTPLAAKAEMPTR